MVAVTAWPPTVTIEANTGMKAAIKLAQSRMAAAVWTMQLETGPATAADTQTTLTAPKTVASAPSHREVRSASNRAQSSTVPSTAANTASGCRTRSRTSAPTVRKNSPGSRESSWPTSIPVTPDRSSSVSASPGSACHSSSAPAASSWPDRSHCSAWADGAGPSKAAAGRQRHPSHTAAAPSAASHLIPIPPGRSAPRRSVKSPQRGAGL